MRFKCVGSSKGNGNQNCIGHMHHELWHFGKSELEREDEPNQLEREYFKNAHFGFGFFHACITCFGACLTFPLYI